MLGQTLAWAMALVLLYPLTHALPVHFGHCLPTAVVWGPLGELQALLLLCTERGARPA